MLTPLLVISLLIALALVSLRVWAVQRRALRRQTIISTRMVGYTGSDSLDELEDPYWTRVLVPTFTGYYQAVASRVTPAHFREELANKLRLAGVTQTPEGFFFSRIAFAAVGLLISVILVLSLHLMHQLFAVLIPVIVALVIFLFPGIRLNTRAEKRRAEIESNLPEVFDLLSVSVEAGMAFDGALRKVVANTTGPVHDEFARVLGDMQVGVPRVQALKSLAERTRSDQLKRFAGLIGQSDQTGAGISIALKIQARDIKEYRANKAREKAATIPIKIMFPMVMFIFPAIFLVILGPALVTVVKLFFHG